MNKILIAIIPPKKNDWARDIGEKIAYTKLAKRKNIKNEVEKVASVTELLSPDEAGKYNHVIIAIAEVTSIPAMRDLLSQYYLNSDEVDFAFNTIKRASRQAIIEKSVLYIQDKDEHNAKASFSKIYRALNAAKKIKGGILTLPYE